MMKGPTGVVSFSSLEWTTSKGQVEDFICSTISLRAERDVDLKELKDTSHYLWV